MAFDENLARQVRKKLERHPGVVEKKMFGGLAFLINGNMSVGVHRDELIVRIAPDETERALEEPGARVFDITGRPMKGWLLIGENGIEQPATLARWIDRGVAYADTLPPK